VPIASSTVVLRSASVMNVFAGSHLPLRTSDGANFANVSGKSMITQPAGLPETSCPASVSKVAWVGFHEMLAPILPPRRSYSVTKSCFRAVPNASLRAPTFSFAPLPNASTAACASTLPWSVSDGYTRQR
jgi:hypothetical protein